MASGRLQTLTTTALFLGGYTAKKSYDNNERSSFFQSIDNSHKLKFSPGSADELLQDSLKTGDLLLFSRRWYYYHIPEAIMIKFYQTLLDTEYDHVGVIVCDKYGEPSVLEKTYFGGYKLRPFSERIAYSKAHQISLVMLNPRDAPKPDTSAPHAMGQPRPPRTKIALSEERNAQLRDDVQNALLSQEFRVLNKKESLSGGGTSTISSVTTSDEKNDNNKIVSNPSIVDCVNVTLVRSVYQRMGLDLVASKQDENSFEQVLSCRHLLNPTETGLNLIDNDYNNDKTGKRYFSKDVVLVRTN